MTSLAPGYSHYDLDPEALPWLIAAVGGFAVGWVLGSVVELWLSGPRGRYRRFLRETPPRLRAAIAVAVFVLGGSAVVVVTVALTPGQPSIPDLAPHVFVVGIPAGFVRPPVFDR